MKILLIHSSITKIGGVETLIVRMCRYLTAQGHEVTLLLNSCFSNGVPDDARMIEEARRNARVLYADLFFYNAARSIRRLDLGHFDFIYCFNRLALLAGLLAQASSPEARVVAGVYHPREYCWKSRYKRYTQRINENILHRIPLSNVFFMNEAFRREQSRCSGRDFSTSPIVPLPIQVERYHTVARRADRRKIVSIGRIVNFKTYNFHMLDVIATLRAEGHDLQYHIYGEGPHFDRLKNLIAQRGMQDAVLLHGTLPYSDLERPFADAFVFVGMGTAVVEAAAAGVPSLPAIESAPAATTYGFLHETRGQLIGEIMPDQPESPILDKLRSLLALKETEYAEIEQRSRDRADEFSMERVMAHFLRSLEASEPFAYPMPPLASLYDFVDLWFWRFGKRLGLPDPLTNQYVYKGAG